MADLVPAVEIAIDDTQTGVSAIQDVQVLFIGIKLAASSGAINTPTRTFSLAEEIEFAGEGSQLVQQLRAARGINNRINVTVLAMNEPAGAQAAGTFTFGGTATTAQPLLIQVEDKTISIPVAIGDDGTAIAASANAVLGGAEYNSLHVTSSAALAVLTLTAKSQGAHGNEINLVNVKVPPGVTSTVAPMAGGTGAPDVGTAIAALGGERYNYWVLPDTDATNLTDVIAELNDRFAPDAALDGHGIAAKRDTVSNLATLGLGLDTSQISIFGDPNTPTSPWAQAGAIASARATQTNPKLTIRNDNLTSITAPPAALYLPPDDRNTLLNAGISPYIYVQGVPRVDRFATLYKTNQLGQPSDALFDAETKLTLSEYRAGQRLVLEPQLGKIWVQDASSTEYGLEVGANIIDPEGLRQILIAYYNTTAQPLGWVSDPERYADELVVTKTGATTGEIRESPTINGTLYRLTSTISFRLA